MDDLPQIVSAAATTSVDGTWQRHAAVQHAATALDGRRGYGRWGTKDGFPVLYLGRPVDSVVVEAYRHLVGPIEDPVEAAALAAQVQPRMLITVAVNVSEILDLRKPATRVQLGLTPDVLQAGTESRTAYAACQRVAQVAHQLGLHGILAPAATELGETLALFNDLLSASDRPARVTDDQLWQHLPADPRTAPSAHLRVVRD
jgi:RES domain-containing protein